MIEDNFNPMQGPNHIRIQIWASSNHALHQPPIRTQCKTKGSSPAGHSSYADERPVMLSAPSFIAQADARRWPWSCNRPSRVKIAFAGLPLSRYAPQLATETIAHVRRAQEELSQQRGDFQEAKTTTAVTSPAYRSPC